MSNMAILLRNQISRNPRMFAQNALNSGRFNNDQMHTNALQAILNGDEQKVKEMVENICKEHHVSVEDAMAQYKKMYGIN